MIVHNMRPYVEQADDEIVGQVRDLVESEGNFSPLGAARLAYELGGDASEIIAGLAEFQRAGVMFYFDQNDSFLASPFLHSPCLFLIGRTGRGLLVTKGPPTEPPPKKYILDRGVVHNSIFEMLARGGSIVIDSQHEQMVRETMAEIARKIEQAGDADAFAEIMAVSCKRFEGSPLAELFDYKPPQRQAEQGQAERRRHRGRFR